MVMILLWYFWNLNIRKLKKKEEAKARMMLKAALSKLFDWQMRKAIG